METIKIGNTGKDVEILCEFLKVPKKNLFDKELDAKVKEFQKKNSLSVDGVVGYNTWRSLILANRQSDGKVSDWDYQMFSKLLGCEKAALKAVVEVETGGKNGFLSSGKPMILFEGHVFWRELKKVGIDPLRYCKDYWDVLYQNWDKTKYLGGEKEWGRLEKASKINKVAAYKSASWGMFQVMGNNYLNCDCSDFSEFINLMKKDSFSQFLLGIGFLRKTGLYKYLVTKDWESFARGYNGGGQVQTYSEKLKKAYNNCK